MDSPTIMRRHVISDKSGTLFYLEKNPHSNAALDETIVSQIMVSLRDEGSLIGLPGFSHYINQHYQHASRTLLTPGVQTHRAIDRAKELPAMLCRPQTYSGASA